MTLKEEIKFIELSKKDLSNFEIIYNEYKADVFRYIQAKTHNRDTTEEVVSITFLKAMENISKFTSTGKSIKCWLFIIARNDLYSRYLATKDSIQLDEEIDSISKSEEQVLDQLMNDEEYGMLIEKLERTSPIQVEILRLKIWDELKFNEIANILGVTTASAKMQYYRALKDIKKDLEEDVTFSRNSS